MGFIHNLDEHQSSDGYSISGHSTLYNEVTVMTI